MPQELSLRFMERFAGLPRAHGRYVIGKQDPTKVKVQGRAETVHEGVTAANWAAHLDGRMGIGIVPIRDDATVRFGAIDVDVYDLDLNELEQRVREARLPLVLCRTKSGGAHLYLFGSEDLPAALVRDKLMAWAVELGYPGVEVFPKQAKLDPRPRKEGQPPDVGNWINMPYFNHAQTVRYAIVAGRILNAEEFLEHAQAVAVTELELHATDFQDNRFRDVFEEAPPCLQVLARKGFGEGGRNNAMFNIGVYLRKRYGDEEWQGHMDQMNATFMQPPLGHREVATVIKSVARKSYAYRCKEPPINAVCSKQICLSRKFGVGGAADDPGVAFGRMTKLLTEPATWYWDINGARLSFTTQELMEQKRFHAACIEHLNLWPEQVSGARWREIVQEGTKTCEELAVPMDATSEGQFLLYLEEFCCGRAPAQQPDELILGKPWTNEARTYFRWSDLDRFIKQQRQEWTNRQAWHLLRQFGGQDHTLKIKGRTVRCWSVPAFEAQKEEHDVPRTDQGPFG